MEIPVGHVLKRQSIRNTTGRALTFILEPWADEVPLASDEELIVELEGPEKYANTFIDESGLGEGYLSLWAWDGSDARILRSDGSVILDWTGLRVPMFAQLDEQRRAAETNREKEV